MAIQKILKNNTQSVLQIFNADVPVSGSYNIPESIWFDVAKDSTLLSNIANGSVVVNNGTSDLNAEDGAKLIYTYQEVDGYDVSFDNSGTGISADNIRDAIVEVKNSTPTGTRFTIVTTFNGSVNNNNWLGYNELLPGNLTPIRIAVACTLKEISFSWNGSNIDGRFELYKNGTVSGNKVYTGSDWTNQAGGAIVTGLNISLVSGDYIIGKWIDLGDNPNDMAVVYYLKP
jgi:hypothetical protein